MAGFGGAVKLTGESAYKKALAEIKRSLNEVSSEMKVAMGKCNGVRAIFPEKKICHAHGIDSPADCQQSPGPS